MTCFKWQIHLPLNLYLASKATDRYCTVYIFEYFNTASYNGNDLPIAPFTDQEPTKNVQHRVAKTCPINWLLYYETMQIWWVVSNTLKTIVEDWLEKWQSYKQKTKRSGFLYGKNWENADIREETDSAILVVRHVPYYGKIT